MTTPEPLPPHRLETGGRGAGTAAQAPAAGAEGVEVVCLGESMVTFLPATPGRLADVPSFDRVIGGAESNVACLLARAGHRARWVSRVGTDGFGDHLLEQIAAHGVDVDHVQRDPRRPTGIYFRTAGERATGAEGEPRTDAEPAAPEARPQDAAPALAEVVYYRAGSAASAMTPDTLDPAALAGTRVVHVTGITAALSDGCLAVLRTLARRTEGRPLLSFDVNYRVGLWQAAADRAAEAPTGGESAGPAVLLELARGCDLVFVGEDEAEAAWGLYGPDAVREALPEPEQLVVKQGHEGVTVYRRQPDGGDEVTFVPALKVDVVVPVGAGDAFAAGYLSATLRGLPVRDRVRHGHLMAAASLTVPGDLGVPPARAHADALAALDDQAWGALRLGPGWTEHPVAVPTPVEVPAP
ncbi:sugar kinase [Streptomyces sp. NPDC059740]|uniref:sugar kinase n=1 Tax=Streptomyces sp. NPDC059740 TaxID=3346926 RepID=UPI00365F3F9A